MVNLPDSFLSGFNRLGLLCRISINRPREAKIRTQRVALILCAKQSTAAQFRQHQFDEIGQAARQNRGHDVVAVGPIIDETFFQLIRDLLRCSDHLPMSACARYAQIKLSNRQVLAACREAGYTRIYTSVPKSESLPMGFTVGRLNIRREMRLEWLSALFAPNSRVLSRLSQQYKIKAAIQSLLGDSVYEKLWAIVNRKEQDATRDEAADNEGSAHNQ